MTLLGDPRRRPVRLASTVVGVTVIWLTVLAFARANPVDLTVALLVVLAELLALAVLSGPVLAALAALAAVVLVNWYLVPPYGTFEIASTENVVALVVFVLVAVVAATLMEVGVRARARAAEADRRVELLGDVVTAAEGDDARTALERVRSGLGLDQVDLLGPRDGRSGQVLASSGSDRRGTVVLDVTLPDGYRLVGRGQELFAPDPEFLASLGSAAVRAFESQQLEAETLRAEELAAIDRARTALLASVGHDLRTPLASLRVSIEALQSADPGLSDDDRALLLATAESSTERLDDLITNLLDMSRLQAGAVLAHPEPTELADVLDRAELSFATDRLSIDLPAGLPAVSADPALLERVVVNLISNALRYSPADTVVTVRAHAHDESVVLEVVDHGPGIASPDRDTVFTPFHRVGAQPDGGSGLGLAIVKGFAEAMGMGIDLAASPGGGLTARLTMAAWTRAQAPT